TPASRRERRRATPGSRRARGPESRAPRGQFDVPRHGTATVGVVAARDVLDRKRQIFALYEQIRASSDPEAAWRLWRETRESLYRTHPQSPLPLDRRDTYRNDCFPYDPAYRVTVELADADASERPLPRSTGGTFAFSCAGMARVALGGEEHE